MEHRTNERSSVMAPSFGREKLILTQEFAGLPVQVQSGICMFEFDAWYHARTSQPEWWELCVSLLDSAVSFVATAGVVDTC